MKVALEKAVVNGRSRYDFGWIQPTCVGKKNKLKSDIVEGELIVQTLGMTTY